MSLVGLTTLLYALFADDWAMACKSSHRYLAAASPPMELGLGQLPTEPRATWQQAVS